jgi:hypothetical protein
MWQTCVSAELQRGPIRHNEVRIFCYLMPVIGKNMISWFYAYVEHIEIKTKSQYNICQTIIVMT